MHGPVLFEEVHRQSQAMVEYEEKGIGIRVYCMALTYTRVLSNAS